MEAKEVLSPLCCNKDERRPIMPRPVEPLPSDELLCKVGALDVNISARRCGCLALCGYVCGCEQKVCVLDGSKAWGDPAVGTSWWTESGSVPPERAPPFLRRSLGEVPHSGQKG